MLASCAAVCRSSSCSSSPLSCGLNLPGCPSRTGSGPGPEALHHPRSPPPATTTSSWQQIPTFPVEIPCLGFRKEHCLDSYHLCADVLVLNRNLGGRLQQTTRRQKVARSCKLSTTTAIIRISTIDQLALESRQTLQTIASNMFDRYQLSALRRSQMNSSTWSAQQFHTPHNVFETLGRQIDNIRSFEDSTGVDYM